METPGGARAQELAAQIARALGGLLELHPLLSTAPQGCFRDLGCAVPRADVDAPLAAEKDAPRALAERARREPYALVALPWSGPGEPLLELCLELEVPVLAVRPCPTRVGLLGATSLTHPELPVLRWSCALGRWLGAPVTLLHLTERACLGCAVEPRALCDQELVEAARARLRRAAEGRDARLLVATREPLAEGIAAATRSARAELLVLGARRRRWWPAREESRLVARALEGAGCSSLLVPLERGLALPEEARLVARGGPQ